MPSIQELSVFSRFTSDMPSTRGLAGMVYIFRRPLKEIGSNYPGIRLVHINPSYQTGIVNCVKDLCSVALALTDP